MFSFLSQNKTQPAGIFLGENRIDLACVGTGSDKPSIDEYVHYTIQDNNISKALRDLRKDFKLNRHNCLTALDTDNYRFIMTSAPKVPQNEMVSALRWQLNDLIDLPLAESTIDIIDIPGIRSNNGEKSIYVVAAENDSIKSVINLMCAEKINLSTIDIPELALRNLASLTPESESGVCLVWLRENNGIIVICKNGYLILTRRFDFGYVDIFSDNNLFANQFIEEIQRSLTFVESHFFNTHVAKLYLCPFPGMNVDRFNAIKEALDKEFSLYILNQYIDNQLEQQALPSNAYLAIGVGIRGLVNNASSTADQPV